MSTTNMSGFEVECIKMFWGEILLKGSSKWLSNIWQGVNIVLDTRKTKHKGQGLSNTLHSMSMVLDTRKSIFGSQQWLQLHIWLYFRFWTWVCQDVSKEILLTRSPKVHVKVPNPGESYTSYLYGPRTKKHLSMVL